MIIIWIEKVRKVTATGSRRKHVTCEGCGVEFTYDLRREVTAEDDSLFSWTEEEAYRKAELNARTKLNLLLDEEEDVVLCPECSWVQERMIEAVRRRSYPTLKQLVRLGLLLTTVCVLLPLGIGVGCIVVGLGDTLASAGGFVPLNIVFGLIAVVSGIGSFHLWFLRRMLNIRYNPNKKPPRRMAP